MVFISVKFIEIGETKDCCFLQLYKTTVWQLLLPRWWPRLLKKLSSTFCN